MKGRGGYGSDRGYDEYFRNQRREFIDAATGFTEVTEILTTTSVTRTEIHWRRLKIYGSNKSFTGYFRTPL